MWLTRARPYGRPMMNQTEIWDDLVGDAWVRHADVIDAHSQPFGAAAMDALGPLDGSTVLDVGCGTGSTTYELARRGAHAVLGTDLSARMVTHARARAVEQHAGDVSFEVGDVLALAMPGHFDVVYSRSGVMFFDDPVAAFSHLRGVARTDGRLGFSCWAEPFRNPWMSLAVMASVPVLGPPHLPAPDEPGPFSLASPDRVRDVLGSAGWRDVTIEDLSIERPHPAGDAQAVAALLVELSPPIAEGLARSPELASDLRAAVAAALRPHERDGEVHLSAAALIVTAAA